MPDAVVGMKTNSIVRAALRDDSPDQYMINSYEISSVDINISSWESVQEENVGMFAVRQITETSSAEAEMFNIIVNLPNLI